MKPSFYLLSLLLLFSFPGISQSDIAAFDDRPLEYARPGIHRIKAAIYNNGNTFLQSTTASWQLDNGPVHSAVINTWLMYLSGVVGGGKNLYVHPDMLTLPSAGNYQFRIWYDAPNGGTDLDRSNDTLEYTIHCLDDLPEKRVLIHYHTHTICGPCYDEGEEYANHIDQDPSAASGVSIHDAPNDPFTIADGSIVDNYYAPAHPYIVFDRFWFPYFNSYEPLGAYTFTTSWGQPVWDREEYGVPVEVSISSRNWDPLTRNLTFTVQARFVADYSGDEFRFNAYLTEDSIFGYQAGAPVPSQYYHRFVLREMMDGPWGVNGGIPNVVNAGAVYSRNYSYTLPSDWLAQEMHIIGLLIDHDANSTNRTVINHHEVDLFEPLVAVQEKVQSEMKLWPNPTSGGFNLSMEELAAGKLSVEVFSSSGALVVRQSVDWIGGDLLRQYDASLWAPGIYFVRLGNENGELTRRLLVN